MSETDKLVEQLRDPRFIGQEGMRYSAAVEIKRLQSDNAALQRRVEVAERDGRDFQIMLARIIRRFRKNLPIDEHIERAHDLIVRKDSFSPLRDEAESALAAERAKREEAERELAGLRALRRQEELQRKVDADCSARMECALAASRAKGERLQAEIEKQIDIFSQDDRIHYPDNEVLTALELIRSAALTDAPAPFKADASEVLGDVFQHVDAPRPAPSPVQPGGDALDRTAWEINSAFNAFGFGLRLTQEEAESLAAAAIRALSSTPSPAIDREKVLEECARIADTDPELPGPMPDEVRLIPIEDALRAAVRATKKSIAARIRSLQHPDGE